MKNIAPKDSLSRRSRQFLSLSFLVLGVGIFLLAVGILLSVVRLVPPTSSSAGLYNAISTLLTLLGIVGIVGAGAMFVRAITWKTDNEFAKTTGNSLAPYFDDGYIYIRNVSKREIGYIDAVLIGLPGVLIFRIVDKTGVLANEGANWLERNAKNEWSPARIDPTRECIADIEKVRQYLIKKMNATVPVFGIVVFMADATRVSLMAKEPVVPISHLQTLHAGLQPNYLSANRMASAEVAAVARLLYGEPVI